MLGQLYYQDPHLRSFQANILERRELNGHPAVILDATAFYPTSGGQPHDDGTLNGIPVLDVQVTDDGRIIHMLENPTSGDHVCGEIDWQRRFDHMQQHTGQHILSQAFVQTLDADTISFHMGSDNCTIDLDRAPLNDEQVALAVQAANQIVIENRPVLTRFVDQGELETLPLRKMPTVTGPIRVVNISNFDWSPCGGTHLDNTGQVGLIQVTRVERRKEQTRIYFLCGWRALDDYTNKLNIVHALATHLTTAEDEVISSVQRLEAELKEAHRAASSAQKRLIEYQMQEWIDQAECVAQTRIVKHVFSDYSLEMVKELARQLTLHPGIVALLAAGQERTHLVFARADDIRTDMGALVRAACAAAGGRGGGRPQFAQGSIQDGKLAEKALSVARHQLLEGHVK